MINSLLSVHKLKSYLFCYSDVLELASPVMLQLAIYKVFDTTQVTKDMHITLEQVLLSFIMYVFVIDLNCS